MESFRLRRNSKLQAPNLKQIPMIEGQMIKSNCVQPGEPAWNIADSPFWICLMLGA
jgi:hypothetical protein